MTLFWAGGFLYNPKTREVLLHQRDGNTKYNPHKWAFFGGTNEGEETPVQTFIREMGEEIGIEIKPEEVMPLCDYPTEISNHRYSFYVESEKKKGKMVLGEGADFDWISLEEVFTYDLTDATVDDLRTFLQV